MIRLAAGFIFLFLYLPALMAEVEVLFLLPSNEKKYLGAVDQIRSNGLLSKNVIVKTGLISDNHILDHKQNTVMVSIGEESYKFLRASDYKYPVIVSFAGNVDSASIPGNYLIITSTVNIFIQAELAVKLLSNKNARIGLFVSKYDTHTKKQIELLIKNGLNITYRIIKYGDNIQDELIRFLKSNKLDAFILVQDDALYTRANISDILYALYSSKVASVGFSSKLVENGAGAVTAAFFTYPIIAEEAARQINKYIESDKLTGGEITPGKARVTINERLVDYLRIGGEVGRSINEITVNQMR